MLLQDILQLFNSPLSHEQTWAVGYGLVKSVSDLLTRNFAGRKAVRMSINLDSVDLNDEGEINVLAIEMSSKTQQQERDLISSTGDVLCRCLNYGIAGDDVYNLHIEDDMAELVGRMVLQLREDHDEGFDDCGLAESWSSISSTEALRQRQPFQSLDDVMCFCEARLVRNDIKGGIRHYQNVCRALHAEAAELETFLNYIASSKTQYEHDLKQYSRHKGQDDNDQSNLKQWAKLWLDVVKEIRMVNVYDHTSIGRIHKAYELTPSESLEQKLKAESEAVLRQEKDFLNLPENARELVVNFLMRKFEKVTEPRDNFTRRKLSFDKGTGDTFVTPPKRDDHEKTGDHKIKPTNVNLKGERHGRCKITPEVVVTPEAELSRSPKKILHVPTPLKFENWPENSPSDSMKPSSQEVENMRKVLPFITSSNDDNHNIVVDDTNNIDEQRDCGDNYAMNQAENNHFEKERRRLSVSTNCLTEIDIEDGVEKNGKLGASFLEICKTRQELTRAETEMIITSNTRARDIKYGKICFGCRKTKFSFLRSSRACEICRKKFCSSCILPNIRIASHLVDFSSQQSSHNNLRRSKHRSLSMGDLSLASNITPFPCRGQSEYDIGSKKTSAGPSMYMCKECKCFVDSIITETRNSRWQVGLQLDL